MPESTMTEQTKPHLVGLAKIGDVDTLRQAVAGWWPGMDDIQPQRLIAGVDAHGDGFVLDGDDPARLAYPVHVINVVILPASMVAPPSAAKPYRR